MSRRIATVPPCRSFQSRYVSAVTANRRTATSATIVAIVALIGGDLLVYFAQRAQPGPTPRSDPSVIRLGVLSGPIGVDLRFELGRLRQDDDALVGHRHETAVNGDAQAVLILPFDTHHWVLDQLRHQRNVPRQNADLAGDGAGEYESSFPRPYLALDRDDVDIHVGHCSILVGGRWSTVALG